MKIIQQAITLEIKNLGCRGDCAGLYLNTCRSYRTQYDSSYDRQIPKRLNNPSAFSKRVYLVKIVNSNRIRFVGKHF